MYKYNSWRHLANLIGFIKERSYSCKEEEEEVNKIVNSTHEMKWIKSLLFSSSSLHFEYGRYYHWEQSTIMLCVLFFGFCDSSVEWMKWPLHELNWIKTHTHTLNWVEWSSRLDYTCYEPCRRTHFSPSFEEPPIFPFISSAFSRVLIFKYLKTIDSSIVCFS